MDDDVATRKRKGIEEKAIRTPSSSMKFYSQVATAIVQGNAGFAEFLGAELMEESSSIFNAGKREESVVADHRCLSRNPRTEYDHVETEGRLRRDYLSSVPIFDGREFNTMFRISRSRFQRIMEDFGATGDQFYLSNEDAFGRIGACFEAKLLLPLKCMAYGVPPHCFRDYFHMSTTLARKCCIHFDRKMREVYIEEYLRCPDSQDIVNINKLHKTVHHVDGMFGSLDCMHTYWKNCPVAWQGSYKGKEKRPSIVLEAIGDYHMWLWHAAYGYAGCMNDIGILTISPFMQKLMDGSFAELESEVVPYNIGSTKLNQMYVLVDGIYPAMSRLVKGYSVPVTGAEKQFTKWQESSRKDIERAFGVLKGKWQCLERPQYFIELDHISSRVCSCLILHNMCVSDRVMDGDVRLRYNAAASITSDISVITYPTDMRKRQGYIDPTERSEVGIVNLGGSATELVTRMARWEFLNDRQVTAQLHKALITHFDTTQYDYDSDSDNAEL
jgi:Plant transposon protein